MELLEWCLLIMLIVVAISLFLKQNRNFNFAFHSTLSISRSSEAREFKKDADQVAFKQPSIYVSRNNGSVQIATGESNVAQCVKDCNFFNNLIEHKETMIDHGIPEEVLNQLILNPTDDEKKKSFFCEYGINLAKILVDVGGCAVSLLKILNG